MKKNKGLVWIINDNSSSILNITFASNTKVDITDYHTQKVPEGVIQNGIVYDSPTVVDLLQKQIKKVTRGEEERGHIDSLFLACPTDKIRTDYIYMEQFTPQRLTTQAIERIEESFQSPITRLRFFCQKEGTNAYIFHAIRHDILQPFIQVATKLNLKTPVILPISNAIAQAISHTTTSPTVIIYYHGEIRAVVANQNRIWIHKPWTIESISVENIREAVNEIRKETHDLMGITPNRVMIIESNELSGDMVEEQLKGLDIELAFFQPKGSAYIEPIDLLITKGLLTTYLLDNEVGFAATHHQEGKVDKLPDIIKEVNKKKDFKVAFLSTILATLMFITGISLAWEFYLKNKINPEQEYPETTNQQTNSPQQEDKIKGVSDVEITLPEAPQEKPKEQKPQYKKQDLSLTILNGNGRTGEAKRIAKMLQDNGFTIEKTDNADRYNYPSTTIFSSSEVLSYAEEIKSILQQSYPLTHTEVNDGLDPKKIIIILGAQ